MNMQHNASRQRDWPKQYTDAKNLRKSANVFFLKTFATFPPMYFILHVEAA